MKKIILLSSLSIILIGCGTTPTKLSDATLVPKSRVISHNAFNVDENRSSGLITISRDGGGFVGQGNYYRVYVDGNPIADLDRGEYFTINVSEGRHILSVESVGLYRDAIKEINIIVLPNDRLKFRVGANHAGDYFINPTAF